MNPSAWVDPRIDRVSVANVEAYLLSLGWKEQPHPGSDLLVFQGPDDNEGEPILQVLPSSERLRDYRMRLEELIAALSLIEDRAAVDILADMLNGTPPNGVV